MIVFTFLFLLNFKIFSAADVLWGVSFNSDVTLDFTNLNANSSNSVYCVSFVESINNSCQDIQNATTCNLNNLITSILNYIDQTVSCIFCT
jgi:hypothetical protein